MLDCKTRPHWGFRKRRLYIRSAQYQINRFMAHLKEVR
ncbi:MAG: hypothetical protein K0S58_2372 [Nitrospira sp.]|jgi:hypothetical protein|nr:hypothetical protein [Nitrospira sp.]